jgi:hypothetical protein
VRGGLGLLGAHLERVHLPVDPSPNYLLGLSWRPFADAGYSNESLAAGFGYIIAHELAHSNLNTPYAPSADALLARYPHDSTKNEGFADVLGVLGMVRFFYGHGRPPVFGGGGNTPPARVPQNYYGNFGQTHPQANTRGDALCATLRDLGV